jgi:hypothetical protein
MGRNDADATNAARIRRTRGEIVFFFFFLVEARAGVALVLFALDPAGLAAFAVSDDFAPTCLCAGAFFFAA